MSQRTRLAAVGAVAILAALAGAWLSRTLIEAPGRPAFERATLLEPALPLPSFRLLDQDGAIFERSSLLGRWHLLFFGFTNCPDVCPNTLTVLAAVDREIADLEEAVRPQVLLVSVDPQRDGPAELKAYVRFFSPEFGAVTGDPADIESFTRQLGVPVARVALDESSYTVDHGTSILVVDPQAKLRAILSAPHEVRIIAGDYRRIVGR